MNEIKLFSPATVANVSCGFDVLGFCLEAIGDEMVIRKTANKGVKITKIEGYDLLQILISDLRLKFIKKSSLEVALAVVLRVQLEVCME